MTKPMDKLLRDALNASAAHPPRTPCLDAGTIAALAEGTLAARERTAAEAHAADCLRCQAVLATLVRTMPPMAPRVWWRRPAFVWLAPLTAAAAAVVVWSSMPRRSIVAPDAQQSAALSAPAGAPNVAPATLPAEPDRRSPAPVPSSAAARTATEENSRSAEKKSAPELMQRARALRDQVTVAPAAPSAPAVAEDRTAQVAAAPPPPAAAPAAEPAPAPAPAAAANADASANRAAAADLRERAAAGALAAPAESARQTLARRFDRQETTIVSADSASRWRLGPLNGYVQHSTDSGATWEALATGVNLALIDGSSPSRSVCWLVGQAGVVVLTTDAGRTWQRLTFPASIDLRSVRATSDKTATVVASDGRTFSTSDGGRTWRRE